MTEHRIALPIYAKTFLAGAKRVQTERVVVMFHRWLMERCMELSAFDGKELKEFLARPSGRAVKPGTANSYRWELKHYLLWLQERGLAGPFDRQEFDGYPESTFPRRWPSFSATSHRPESKAP
jgi:hypothetical protein